MATQDLLKLLLLLKLMMRNMLTTVWCRFGRLTLVIKLSFFCSVPGDKVSRFVQDSEVVPGWGTMIACHMKAKYIYTYAG